MNAASSERGRPDIKTEEEESSEPRETKDGRQKLSRGGEADMF